MNPILSAVVSCAVFGCAQSAIAQCAPATLTVTGSYSVNGQASPPLILVEGQSYLFNVSGVSSAHPLILTTSATGGSFTGQLSAAQIPGYVAGGACSTCPVSQFTITPGPTTPTSFFYQCHVHGGLGDSITILRKPVITQQPTANGVCPGGMLMLEIAATIPGGGAPTYQWRKDGVNIAGETDPTFMVHSMLAQDSGTYDCVVSNSCAKTNSSAVLTSICPADLASANGAGCDGGVDINDLLYFLGQFEAGSAAVDVDNDGAEPQALDGGVDINDLLYFLVRFEAGC